MEHDKGFTLRQRAWNDTSYPICCLVFGGIQLAALLATCLWYRHTPFDEVHWGYPLLAGVALAGAAAFYFLDRWLRRWERPKRIARFAELILCLVWSMFFSAVELQQGHETHVFTQTLMFLSASFRLPTRLHCVINAAAYAVCALLLCFLEPNAEALSDGLANNAIYLTISCGVIVGSNRIQYEAYRADRERERVQAAQLDAMAEQVEKTREAVERSRVLRHDLRHYATVVAQGLEREDYAGIRTLTQKLTGELDELSARQRSRSFTGLAEVDAALERCAVWAEGAGVRFRAELPRPAGMEPRDFNLLLMNALENACNAVRKQPAGQERSISVIGSAYQKQYYLEIVNTCLPEDVVISRSTGLPVAREPGHGYGVKSMASILERYHAFYRFWLDGARFGFQMIIPTGEE